MYLTLNQVKCVNFILFFNILEVFVFIDFYFFESIIFANFAYKRFCQPKNEVQILKKSIYRLKILEILKNASVCN